MVRASKGAAGKLVVLVQADIRAGEIDGGTFIPWPG